MAAKKKLTKAERAVQETMLKMLEYMADHPTEWHSIGKFDEWKEAVRLLDARGVIEIWPETNQYRFKSKT